MGSERERHLQYKNLLNDLSHNLKTPISVLQNIGENDAHDGNSILQQTQSMQDALARYVQRATIKSPSYLCPAIAVTPTLNRITQSLRKLYDSSSVTFHIAVDEQFTVRIDQADLMEILGNLLENACKYGASDVIISLSENRKTLTIQDDGPGWPEGELSQYTQRGVRADTQIEGQGIGLAASGQILRAYGGNLELSRVDDGGARVELHFS